MMNIFIIIAILIKIITIASLPSDMCWNSLNMYQIGESEELTSVGRTNFSLEVILKQMNQMSNLSLNHEGEALEEATREKILSQGHLLEGDILLDSNATLKRLLDQDADLYISGKGYIGAPWPKATVPFAFQESFTVSDHLAVALAMEEIQSVSCVKFKMKKNEQDYIRFYKSDGCASHVGFQQGVQGLSLSDDCLKSQSVIMHLLMHALGFWHETSRPDRNKNILVNWNNVDPKYICNYRKFSILQDGTLLPYDPQSILHFSRWTFSTDPRKPAFDFARNHERENDNHDKRPTKLSKYDIEKLIQKYGCSSESKTKTTQSWNFFRGRPTLGNVNLEEEEKEKQTIEGQQKENAGMLNSKTQNAPLRSPSAAESKGHGSQHSGRSYLESNAAENQWRTGIILEILLCVTVIFIRIFVKNYLDT